MLPVQEIQPDQKTIDHIEAPKVEALEQAGKLLADTSRTNEWLRAEILKKFEAASAEITTTATQYASVLDSDIAKLQGQTKMRFAPDSADAPLLLYVRGSLEAKASQMGTLEFQQFWEDALAGNDRITLRVLHDFSSKLTGLPVNGRRQKLAEGPKAQDLMERTRKALLTPEQQKAAQQLEQAKATRRAIDAALNRATAELGPRFRITPERTIETQPQREFAAKMHALI